MLSDIRHGTLRRTNSAELISELGDEDGGDESEEGPARVQVYRGLRIADRPSDLRTAAAAADPANDGQTRRPRSEAVRTRVRHNSDGNYDDVSLMQETILSTRGGRGDAGTEMSIYQNLIPQPLAKPFASLGANAANNNNNSFSCSNRNAVAGSKLELFKIEPLNKRESASACCSGDGGGGSMKTSGPLPPRPPPTVPRKSVRQQLNFSADRLPSGRQLITSADSHHRPLVTGLPLSSDTSSVDSHNDSGYSTRIAVSEGGPSPALLEPDEEEPLLDPQALYMIPPDLRSGGGKSQRMSGSVELGGAGSRAGICGLLDLGGGIIINPKSSFV